MILSQSCLNIPQQSPGNTIKACGDEEEEEEKEEKEERRMIHPDKEQQRERGIE